jgi:hypothetical protein
MSGTFHCSQYSNVSSEEEAVLLPTGEFSTDQNNTNLQSRSQIKAFVDLMLMDCSTIYPSVIPVVFDTHQLDNGLPMSQCLEAMRIFYDNASIKDLKYCSLPRVLNAWIKLLDTFVGEDISLKMKPKKEDVKIF